MRRDEIAGDFPAGFVTVDELAAVLAADNRGNLLIGGLVDKAAATLTLWRGDRTKLVVAFAEFPPADDGRTPDFDHFAVTDFGHTVRLGDYEAPTDFILAGFKRVPKCWE